jgi:methionyl-tRNA formyltransferase
MTDVLLVGDDKLGRRLLARLGNSLDVAIALDHSSNLKRVITLVIGKRLPLRVLLRIAWAELYRPDYPRITAPIIRTNDSLQKLIHELQAKKVYLFRAGLIIGRKLLDENIEILNVHCARLPEYGGLGAVDRALNDGVLAQCATLHRVTTRIDGGEVLQTLPYQLDPRLSYADNEERAYAVGIELLVGELSKTWRNEPVARSNSLELGNQSAEER